MNLDDLTGVIGRGLMKRVGTGEQVGGEGHVTGTEGTGVTAGHEGGAGTGDKSRGICWKDRGWV